MFACDMEHTPSMKPIFFVVRVLPQGRPRACDSSSVVGGTPPMIRGFNRDHLHHAARPCRPTLPAGSGVRFFEESTMSHDDPTERATRILIERQPGPGIRLDAFLSLSPAGLEPNTLILCRLPGSMGYFPYSPARRLHRDHASDRPRHERQVQGDIDGRTCRQTSGMLNIQSVSCAGPRAHLQLRTVNSSAELQAGRPDRHGSPRGPHLSCSTYCISRPYPV